MGSKASCCRNKGRHVALEPQPRSHQTYNYTNTYTYAANAEYDHNERNEEVTLNTFHPSESGTTQHRTTEERRQPPQGSTDGGRQVVAVSHEGPPVHYLEGPEYKRADPPTVAPKGTAATVGDHVNPLETPHGDTHSAFDPLLYPMPPDAADFHSEGNLAAKHDPSDHLLREDTQATMPE